MNKNQVEDILKSVMRVEFDEPVFPAKEDWDKLESYFDCKFCDEFKYFIDLMSVYAFPGEIYNAAENSANGNDTIIFVYDYESAYDVWDKDMIPFCGIGNGDYICISRKTMQVFYYYADACEYEKMNDTFSDRISALPEFLNGE